MKFASALLCLTVFTASAATLRDAITFHASFDQSVDADFGRGDLKLYNAPTLSKRNEATAGLPATQVVSRVPNGKFGQALRFHKKAAEFIFFQAKENVAYATNRFEGTVSFWLSLTPDEDLEPGFTDPIQITPKQWDDAAFFVEFSKDEKPREFRLGAYADKNVWNPKNRPWGEIPFAEKPLVPVIRPPFKREEWTHVVFTFANYNSGKADGETHLYLNGELKGSLSPRQQTFTWNPAETKIMLGLSYIGAFDELTIFNRALTVAEVRELHQLPGGVTAVLKK
jgi:hypothetical protein